MREDGWRASDALAYARAVAALPAEVDSDGWTFERDGYTCRVTVTPDEWGMDDWRGTLMDTWSPGAILTESHRHDPDDGGYAYRNREYRWFVPMQTASELREGFSRAGMARHVADCRARETVERDYRAVADPYRCEYVVTVTAYREGIEQGSASLGGVDIGDDYTANLVYLSETADELTGEAIDAARDALARLAATV
jgi:hypothetical protein